jgi:hypothetical protein
MPTTTRPTINFDKPKVERLRTAVAAAKSEGQTQFTFDGHDLIVSYATYMLEYLDTKFSDRNV